MGYPFGKSILSEPSRQKSLCDLAASKDKVFDTGFPDRMPSAPAFDLDTFAKGAMKHYTGNVLPSCDAVIKHKKGRFYLIEFKNQAVANVDGNKILSKVFGSLLMVNMTTAQNITLRELMKRAIAIVVFPEQDYSTMLGYALAHSAIPGRPILWGLGTLVDAEMLADAYTMTDKEFNQWCDRELPKELNMHDENTRRTEEGVANA